MNTLFNRVTQTNPNEKEFLQAVQEFLDVILPFVDKNPKYKENSLLERLLEPERVISFRIPWQDDKGNIQVNRGYRVQFNSAIGPYKGGLRFHPSVNTSILKFLGFEQVFKNALTTLPMGGGKGGSDFDPKGKSNEEIMRFCQAFMQEMYKYIGRDIDVPAGDIGVSGREIGYLFGMYKKLTGSFEGVFTGKGLTYGGSILRTEATGYGVVYFLQEILHRRGDFLKGKTVLISGSGNVAQYTAEKAISEGAIVLTMSDSNGYIYTKNGLTTKQLELIMNIKNVERKRISEATQSDSSLTYVDGKKPWSEKADIVLPCATQNEISRQDAELLINNGVKYVVEGANMPCTIDAMQAFQVAQVEFCPGKASNAGGVATSGLEMTQNSIRMYWTREEVDEKLKSIMRQIHDKCVMYGKEENGYINYVKGANIAGFIKVADAMIAQGVV